MGSQNRKPATHDVAATGLTADDALAGSTVRWGRSAVAPERDTDSIETGDAATPCDRLLHTVPHTAQRLDSSESTIWRLLRSGRLRPTYVLGRTMISESELKRFISTNSAGSKVENPES